MASVLRFILMEFTSWGGVSPDFCKILQSIIYIRGNKKNSPTTNISNELQTMQVLSKEISTC